MWSGATIMGPTPKQSFSSAPDVYETYENITYVGKIVDEEGNEFKFLINSDNPNGKTISVGEFNVRIQGQSLSYQYKKFRFGASSTLAVYRCYGRRTIDATAAQPQISSAIDGISGSVGSMLNTANLTIGGNITIYGVNFSLLGGITNVVFVAQDGTEYQGYGVSGMTNMLFANIPENLPLAQSFNIKIVGTLAQVVSTFKMVSTGTATIRIDSTLDDTTGTSSTRSPLSNSGRATRGGNLSILGAGFMPGATNPTVWIGGLLATVNPISGTPNDNEIIVNVPNGLTVGNTAAIEIQTSAGRRNKSAFTVIVA